jgi:hypothetical protein
VPYFNRQVAPNGSLLVSAFIGVSQARRHALSLAGRPVPESIPILGLIDTGASCSCVDPSILVQLNLSPTGSSFVNSPTTGTQPAIAEEYDVSITIPGTRGSPALMHHTVPILKAELFAAQGFQAIIGRDVLQGCMLTYDGKGGVFYLAF